MPKDSQEVVQLNWPIIHRHCSQDALDHATSLEQDFEALDACVKLSTSKHHRLPSSLREDISKGIQNPFSDHEYPYESTEADIDLIGELLLKHITAEAAERARNRFPLQLYHDLRESYQDLVAKLNVDGGHLHPGAMTMRNQCGANRFMELSPLEPLREIRDSVSRESEAVLPATASNEGNTYGEAARSDCFRDTSQGSTHAAVATNRLKKNGRTKQKRDEFGRAKKRDVSIAREDRDSSLELMGSQSRLEKADLHKEAVYNGTEIDDQDTREDLVKMFQESEAQCERICLHLQDFESEQPEEPTMWHVTDAPMENGDLVKHQVVKEDNEDAELVEGDTLVNEPSGDAQRRDSEPRGVSDERVQHSRELVHEVREPDASFLITFKIEQQAAVTILNDMCSDVILHKLSSSLETMRSLGNDVPDSIDLTNATLLDNGNIEVHAHAESKEDNERLSRIRGWDLEFEKSIYTLVKSYSVETSRFGVDSLNMQTRKHKATAIKEIIEENVPFVIALRGVDDIRNIRWCKEHKKISSLIIEFRTPELADAILDSGVFVHGKLYNCQYVDQKLRRCSRCQAFGHLDRRCHSAHRCGTCALQHATSDCTSSTRLCANCNGPHIAKAKTCPARDAHKRRLRYTNRSSPIGGTERAAPARAPQDQQLTAVPNLSLSNPMPVTPHNEGEIKVEEDESLQTRGSVRDHHQGRAAIPTRTPVSANPQHEPFTKAGGSEPTHEIRVAEYRHVDFTSIQRQLADLQKTVEHLSAPRRQHSQRRKREANEMLTGEPPPHARKQPKRAKKKKYRYPTRNRPPVPADWGSSPYAAPRPGEPMLRQVFLRTV